MFWQPGQSCTYILTYNLRIIERIVKICTPLDLGKTVCGARMRREKWVHRLVGRWVDQWVDQWVETLYIGGVGDDLCNEVHSGERPGKQCAANSGGVLMQVHQESEQQSSSRPCC